MRKALYRIPEAMVLLSMSRTVIYEQIKAGRLRVVREGRAVRVSAAAIADYVALLERESMAGAA
ncbi:helix-turn-helix domain-containing protein [Planosporangium sp. 12N6]|uniref:helix-turn-helix domain-containing protein n=1 Tax=Planosporangium spinosum TaxID=3402278 RepID=UPI003CF7BD95